MRISLKSYQLLMLYLYLTGYKSEPYILRSNMVYQLINRLKSNPFKRDEL